MLRYTLTLPTRDNDGLRLSHAHAWLRTELLGHFGAYTAHRAVGAWRGTSGAYTEPVRVYTIDAPDTSESYAKLRALAEALKVSCGQEAIYLTRQPVETWLV